MNTKCGICLCGLHCASVLRSKYFLVSLLFEGALDLSFFLHVHFWIFLLTEVVLLSIMPATACWLPPFFYLKQIICSSVIMMITSYRAHKLFLWPYCDISTGSGIVAFCHITTSSAQLDHRVIILLLFVYLEYLLVLWCFYGQLLFSSLILNEVCGYAI